MIVVADTSPISYLILIDEVGILPRLYGEIIIPRAVFAELIAPNAPSKVRLWFENCPAWLETRKVAVQLDVSLSILDSGETEAIQLAKEIRADLIMIDELLARRIAIQEGLNVIGLIGILAAASRQGLVMPELVIAKLRRTNFFFSEDLIEFLKNSKK